MQNNKLIPISIVILSISILLSSIWLGYSLQKSARPQSNSPEFTSNVFTLSQVASYLGMTEEEVMGIISTENKVLNANGSYSVMRFPHFKVNEKPYFYKEQVDEWLKEVTLYLKDFNLKEGYIN